MPRGSCAAPRLRSRSLLRPRGIVQRPPCNNQTSVTAQSVGEVDFFHLLYVPDGIDPDSFLAWILALQLVHFRLVRIGADQIDTSRVRAAGLFSDQQLLQRNDSGLLCLFNHKISHVKTLVIFSTLLSCVTKWNFWLDSCKKKTTSERTTTVTSCTLPLAWFR